MKTAQRLQEIVETSAQRFNLDLNAPEAYLRIEDQWEKSITIQRIDINLLMVGEYTSVDGRAPVGSPEFILFTGAEEWLPVGHETLEKGYRQGALLSPDNTAITAVIPKVQIEIAIECDWWARALQERDYSEAEATFEPGYFIPSWEKKQQ